MRTTLAGLWLLVAAGAVGSQEPKNGPPAPPATRPGIPADRLEEIRATPADDLIKALARAKRLDPVGQGMLRDQVHIKCERDWFLAEIAKLKADPNVARALEVLGRPAVRAEIDRIRGLAAADRDAAIDALYRAHELEQEWVDGARDLKQLKGRVAEYEDALKLVQARIARHAAARVAVVSRPSTTGPGVVDVAEIVKRYQADGTDPKDKTRPAGRPTRFDSLNEFASPPARKP